MGGVRSVNAGIVRTKICGVTNVEDAEMIADADATYLGMVLSPGFGRSIGPGAGKAIARSARRRNRRIRLVGVFVDEGLAGAAAIAQTLSLDVAQLHGRETPTMAARLQELGPWSVWKALGVARDQSPEGIRRALRPYVGHVSGIVLDGRSPSGRSGGEGRTFPWEGAGAVVREELGQSLFVAAGGLNPGNATEALEGLGPDVIDASSGLEAIFARKDPKRVRAFLECVRRWNEER